jgi:cyclic pyranopterin phosphate synthase
MIDPFGRAITYLRVSVTDRCDLRCVYCMAEDMTFLPKAQVLSWRSWTASAAPSSAWACRSIRLTGGEPLVRKDVMTLVRSLGARLGHGLKELTITTNGTQLTKHAETLPPPASAASMSASTRWTPAPSRR